MGKVKQPLDPVNDLDEITEHDGMSDIERFEDRVFTGRDIDTE